MTESDVPDTSNAAEDTCSTITYTTNTTAWIVDLPATVQVVDLPCGTVATQSSQLVSDTQYTYDSGGTPTAGNLTKTQAATAASVQNLFGSYVWSYTYTTEQTSTFDQYGRVLTAKDADNRTTTTAYTPATGAEPTSVAVTDPANLTTTTTYDPARTLATGVTDPAGYQSAEIYDALGRVTAQWTPGNPTSGPAVNKFSYTDSATAPSVDTRQAEQPGGGYLTSETLYDSLGQIRETQQQTADGGTDVSDTSYNSDGWQALVSDPYYTSGAPSGTLVSAAPGSVPSQTGYVYDGAGRVIKQVAYALGTQTWETDTTYGGNYVTVVPPSGGTSQTTFSDGRGLITAVYQYHAGVPASPSDPSSQYDQTSYTYTPAQELASIQDAASNSWSYTYDLLGNQLTATDPDAGTTTSTYDAAGQLMTVTDARSKQVSYTYDGDGRKTAEYDTTGGAQENTADQLASWTWDTLARGQLTSSTSFSGGNAYTEAVAGYNSFELPSGTQTVIPAAQGALAGTYTQQDSYAPDGQLTSYTDSAAGGLPSETVTTGYDSAGDATSLTGASPYVDTLSYTNLGEPLQYTMGTSSLPAYVTDSYDAQTRRLAEQKTQTGTAQSTVDDLHYSYDNFGNVNSEADTLRRGPHRRAVLPVRLPRPPGPGLGPGRCRLRGHPVGCRRGRGLPLLERLQLQHRRRPYRHYRHSADGGGDHDDRRLPGRGSRAAARHHELAGHHVIGLHHQQLRVRRQRAPDRHHRHRPERDTDLGRRGTAGAGVDHAVRRFGPQHELRLRRRRHPAAHGRPGLRHAVPARRGAFPQHQHRRGHRHPLLQHRRRHRRRPHRRLRCRVPGRRQPGHRLGRHRRGHPQRQPALLRSLRQPQGLRAA